MLTITPTQLTLIQDHSLKDYPHECVGALLGTVDSATGHKFCIELITLENTSTENKQRRFAITDQDYKWLEEQAKDKQLSLLGFYHSHPDHPAQPSETDLKFAWPFFSYLIQSVNKETAIDCLSYVLDVATGQFVSEELVVKAVAEI